MKGTRVFHGLGSSTTLRAGKAGLGRAPLQKGGGAAGAPLTLCYTLPSPFYIKYAAL